MSNDERRTHPWTDPSVTPPTSHKHGKTSKGSQRYRCAGCGRTFTDTLDTLYYRRQVTPEQAELILQAHAEGSNLRGIARMSPRAYGTVVSLVRTASSKAQMVHNEEVKDVECEEIAADEMWSFVKKSKNDARKEN